MIKSLENIICGESLEPNLAYQREGYKRVAGRCLHVEEKLYQRAF